MNPELAFISHHLARVSTPEQLFGLARLPGDDLMLHLKKNYHALVKVAHPDLYHSPEEQLLAEALLGQINNWFKIAQHRISAGSYGSKDAPTNQVSILTRKRSYTIVDRPDQNGIFNLYPCSFEDGARIWPAALQIVRDPEDNDLAQNEISILERLRTDPRYKSFSAYLPRLIDSFNYPVGANMHQATIFRSFAGWVSLEDVRKAYPAGVDPKDMAWIWRRLLTALGFAHRNGLVHGAILPANITILPEQHGLMIRNWSYAVCEETNSWTRVLENHPENAAWFTADILNSEAATASADILLSAKCMLYILGADPASESMPAGLSVSLRNFFRGCVLRLSRAPRDAWVLLSEFDILIDKLWGERKFHPFNMP